MSSGTISGNATTGNGGGVCVTTGGTFDKTDGVIYSFDSLSPLNPQWNQARNSVDGWGHAAFYDNGSQYYRDTTLDSGDNINNTDLPIVVGVEGHNWTLKAL